MASNFEDVSTHALELPADERAQLAYCLALSLEEEMEPAEEVEALWLEEIERRLAQLRSGSATTIDADEAMRRAFKALEK